MKTNEIYVTNDGSCREEVLSEVEKYTDYQGVTGKKRIHLRLLTEELLGMVNEITGKFYAYFWIEDDNKNYYINLQADVNMDPEMREELLKSSTSGKNAAAKGVMGKIKNLFQTYLSGLNNQSAFPDTDSYSYYTFGADSMSTFGSTNVWSLAQYKTNVSSEIPEGRMNEEWDELERSIVANIADDVSVGIDGSSVKIVVTTKR